jgi:phosphotransferase system HPr-like phosphotransfer protein
MLAAAQGSNLVVETDGPDEGPAMDAVIRLIAGRFEEKE